MNLEKESSTKSKNVMLLFNQIIFGPLHSRRLGLSLGVNLLPVDAKICSFDCIYCECGFNTNINDSHLPSRTMVYQTLELKLQQMHSEGTLPDVITFAGNGEPTLHPEFEGIIDDTLKLKKQYCSDAKVSVLSNASMLHKPTVFRALMKVENNILKLDSAVDETVKRLDRPTAKTFNVIWLINQLKKFEGKLIIQTMFLRGMVDGKMLDNTTEIEISAWIEALGEINPEQVMIYSIDRETPTSGLEKIPLEMLEKIADRVREAGFVVSVAG